MILTGKAKEHFYKWLLTCKEYEYNNFNIDCEENNMLRIGKAYLCKIPDCFTYALIIEWFDSVGYMVTIKHMYFGDFEFEIDDKEFGTIASSLDKFTSRQEAMKQAIIKANEIYNSL